MLISRLNRNAVIIETAYGEERLVGWSARPFLGFVVVLPFVAVAYVIASLAFHWIMPEA
jgi:hypothetical protein